MKYKRVTIEGKEYYRVPEHDVNAFICDKCHFYHETGGCLVPPEYPKIVCYSDDDPILYLLMTESELARENIPRRKEKKRNV